MAPILNLSRRELLVGGALAGGGLLLGVTLPLRSRAADPAATAQPFAPNAFLRIAPDGSVTVLSKHSEMGQGVLTSIAMVAAEELDADWSRVVVEVAPAGEAFKHTAYGLQVTGGSSSSWESTEEMRKAGATARAMLISAAAARWGVDASACTTEPGFVVHGKDRLGYGDLAADAAKLAVPTGVPLKDPKQFRLIGHDVHRVDSLEKVTGRGVFGIDVRVPGMLFAVIARPPSFGGSVKGVKDAKAKAVAGVRHVVRVSSGVAVVADSTFAAMRGRDALEVEWNAGPNGALDSAAQDAEYAALVAAPGRVALREGDAAAAFAAAPKKIEATYDFPYLAHACMEPVNATAHVREDGVDVWAPTQMQTIDQQVAAQIAGVPETAVKIHTTLLGGGFGRKANPKADFVADAVHVSKAIGKPVQVLWTREDDMRGGWYRPRTHVVARAGLGADGALTAFTADIVSQGVMLGTPFGAGLQPDAADESQVEGLSDFSYAAPNAHVVWHPAPAGVPVLWWRSVGHSYSAFVKEALIDEAATAAGRDPIEYRIAHLKAHPRQIAVLERLRDAAQWGKAPKGRFQGVAIHESFRSIVGQVAEISLDAGKVRVHKVTVVIDPGTVINPDTVRAQMLSGVIYGLSAALYGEITLREGKVVQSNFHDYPAMRMNEAPTVDVVILESGAAMGGVGEPGTPPIAPAVANAIAAADGRRIRSLPLRKHGLA